MITFKKTNGTTILTVVPNSMTYDLYAVNAANSGRNTAGKMFTNRVTQKRKLELSFNGKTWAEVSSILTAVNDEYFKVTYPDMLTGSNRTMDCYRGDVGMSVFTWWDNQKMVTDVKISLIER